MSKESLVLDGNAPAARARSSFVQAEKSASSSVNCLISATAVEGRLETCTVNDAMGYEPGQALSFQDLHTVGL